MPACIYGKDILELPLNYTQREINKFAQAIVYNMYNTTDPSSFDFCNGECTVMGINNYDSNNNLNDFYLDVKNAHCADSFSVDKKTW